MGILFEERGYRFLLPGYPAMEKGGFFWEQVLENADFYRARLWNERQMVFDEDRVDLLETMLEFLNSHAENGRVGKEDHCEVYGVAHFEDLFERLLGECLKNQIEVQKVKQKDVFGKITQVSFDSRSWERSTILMRIPRSSPGVIMEVRADGAWGPDTQWIGTGISPFQMWSMNCRSGEYAC